MLVFCHLSHLLDCLNKCNQHLGSRQDKIQNICGLVAIITMISKTCLEKCPLESGHAFAQHLWAHQAVDRYDLSVAVCSCVFNAASPRILTKQSKCRDPNQPALCWHLQEDATVSFLDINEARTHPAACQDKSRLVAVYGMSTGSM